MSRPDFGKLPKEAISLPASFQNEDRLMTMCQAESLIIKGSLVTTFGKEEVLQECLAAVCCFSSYAIASLLCSLALVWNAELYGFPSFLLMLFFWTLETKPQAVPFIHKDLCSLRFCSPPAQWSWLIPLQPVENLTGPWTICFCLGAFVTCSFGELWACLQFRQCFLQEASPACSG